MTTLHIAIIVTAGMACVWDLRTGRIPNALTFGAAAAALIFHVVTGGVAGFTYGIFGWLVGTTLLFALFALGGMGAGDLKLLGALGAWLGPRDALSLILFTSLAGGAMALLVGLVNGYLPQAWRNLSLLLMHWRVVGLRSMPELTLETSRGPRLAYAAPILAGAIMTLWIH